MKKTFGYFFSRIVYIIRHELTNMFFYMWNRIVSKWVDCFSRILGKELKFEDIISRRSICLYAGDLVYTPHYSRDLIGLVLHVGSIRSIQHDITNPMPLPNNCVDSYQAEDVFEHIEIEKIPFILEEIYRVLKEGGVLRISVPDYCNEHIKSRCIYKDGIIVFDPYGGGNYVDNKVVDGGHVWFPVYNVVKKLIEESSFRSNYEFYHYIDEEGNCIKRKIDYSKGYVQRTFDHITGNGASSIVVDCYKRV